MLFGTIPLVTFFLILLVTFAPALVFSAADLGNPLDSRIIINLMKILINMLGNSFLPGVQMTVLILCLLFMVPGI